MYNYDTNNTEIHESLCNIFKKSLIINLLMVSLPVKFFVFHLPHCVVDYLNNESTEKSL